MREFIVRCENNKFTLEGEIVHCKDCNHSYEAIIERRADGYEDEAIICKRFLVGGEVRVSPDFYCGYGERKAVVKGMAPVTPKEQQKHSRLIDADKLLQELFNVDEEEWTTPEIRTILKNAPSVEPERPKGEWINDLEHSGWTCTHCNYHDGNRTDRFCPNCGADMRGEEDD